MTAFATPRPAFDAAPPLGTTFVSIAVWRFAAPEAAVVAGDAEVGITVLEPTVEGLEAGLAAGHEFDVVAAWPSDAEEAAEVDRIVRVAPPRLAVLTVGPHARGLFPDSALLPWDVWHEADPSLAIAAFAPLLRSVREREALEAIETHRRVSAALDEVLAVDGELQDTVAAAMHVLARGLDCAGAAFWRPSALGRSLIRVGCTGADPALDRALAGDDRRPPADCDRLLQMVVAGTPAGRVLRTGEPLTGPTTETSLILPARANGRVCGVVVLSGASRLARRRTSFELAVSAADRVAVLVHLHLAAQQFKALTARSPLAITVTDASGIVVSFNEAASRMCGVSRETALESPVTELLTRASREAQGPRIAALAQTVHEDRPVRAELPIHFVGAPERYVELTISAWGEGLDRRFALIAQDIGERRANERRIAELAYADRVTGLPNQPALVAALEHSVRPVGGLIALEICRFDRLVESLGSAGADAALRAHAARLKATLPDGETLFHLSRAQFVVTVPEADASGLLAAARRLCAVIAQPLEVEGAHLYTRGVAGACAVPRECRAMNALDGALRALRQAREADGPPCFYDPSHPPDLARLRREADLHAAVGGGELRLHYQPIVDLAGGRVLGYEGLARWQHPELGLLGPHLFIDLAEENGLIVEIGRWVVEETCRRLAVWNRAGFTGVLSFNVAPRQLLSDTFAADVLAIARAHGVDPGRLVAEVVESAALGDLDSARENLARLRAGGVRIALDDFGVGESSLGRLVELPVDVLKIDRSLVRGLAEDDRGSRAVPSSALLLGSELGIHVVTEGIESEAQRARLCDLGGSIGQGFLFGRPEPVERIAPGHIRNTP